MNAKRALAVARRIAQGFRRDHRTLGLIFVVPVAITLLLGWVIRDQKDTTVAIAVVNEAGPAGARLQDALVVATAAAPDGLDVLTLADDVAAGEAALRNGNADLVVVIPASLAGDVTAGRRPVFTVITSGIDPASDGAAFGRLQQLLISVVPSLLPGGSGLPIPEIERRTLYLDPDADTLDVLAPVFLGYFAYFFVFILTGISFLRERIGGTLERLLATPVTRGEIVVGYVLGFGLFATIQVVILIAVVLGRIDIPALGPLPAFAIGLGVHSTGSPVLAFALALLLALGAVNLGIFLSTFARTELQVLQFIPLVIVPQGLLSGIFWPVERLPDVLQVVAHALPLTYAVDGLREVMLRGAGLGDRAVVADLGILALVSLVFVVLATRTIQREVA